MTVVSVCAPTNPSNATSKVISASEAFYNQLQDTMSSVPPSDLLVTLDDFNAHVGSNHSSWNQ